MPHRGDGPIPARVMIVGEAWGKDEDEQGQPFVGAAGSQLNSQLHDARIMRTECFVTNVVNYRPPDNNLRHWIAFNKKKDRTHAHVDWRGWPVLPIVRDGYNALMAEIAAVQPNVIIATGNLALHALVEGCIKLKPTGPSGILKWRGSQLRMDTRPDIYSASAPSDKPKVIPTVHPAAVLREFGLRSAAVTDLRRAARHMQSKEYTPPKWQFIIRPSFTQAIQTLDMLIARLDAGTLDWIELDLETRAGHIACCGISWSRTEAIIIPLMCVENREGYWSAEEEAEIVWRLYKLMRHPRVKVRGQNLLYDAQYTYRHWHFIPRVHQDTMISQHTLWSDRPKGLGYLASIYCHDYVYWKDEGKDWDKKLGEDQLWAYNGQDDVYTREVGEVLLDVNKTFSTPNAQDKIVWPQLPHVHAFQQAMFWPVLWAMIRGVRVIKENKSKLAGEVQEQIDIRQGLLEQMIGRPINIDSPPQMNALFYEELGQQIIWKKRGKGQPSTPTCDDDALNKIAIREPLLKPLVHCVQDIRTLQKYMQVILCKLDVDGRMRCSFNIGGSESGKTAPKTFRLSSSENAFDSGTNLQNISSEKSKSVGKAVARGHMALLGDPYSLPNVRSIFGPDPGFTDFDLDLDRADLQVVVWEADDAMLKAALRLGADIHLLNAFVLQGKEPPPLDELVETHPKYWDHRGSRKFLREFAKVFCHATNYLGGARTVAQHTGRTVHEVDRAQKIWFGAHPGIKSWHDRVITQIKQHKFIENRFGYRWYIFDRIDEAASEAVAWIPQSTVSIVINRIWMALFQNKPWEECNLDPNFLMTLMGKPAWEVQVLLQVHDSLAGQFPTHRKEYCVQRIQELSRIVIPYEDPLVIPTGIGTSENNWGEC